MLKMCTHKQEYAPFVKIRSIWGYFSLSVSTLDKSLRNVILKKVFNSVCWISVSLFYFSWKFSF